MPGTSSGILRGRPLSHYLVMLIFSVLMPAVILAGALVVRTTHLDRDRANREALQLARSAASALDREIEGSIESLTALATSPAIQNGDFASFYDQMKSTVRLRNRNALLSNVNGQQIVNTRVAFGTPLPLDDTTGYLAPVLRTEKPSISDLVVGAVAKKWVVAFSVPVFVDEKLTYVLSMSIDPEHIHGIIAQEKVDPGWVISVNDSQHKIIARTLDHANFVGQTRKGEADCTEREGVTRGYDSAGQNVISAHSCLNQADWRVTAFVPGQVIDAPLRRLWWMFAASTVAFLVAALPLAILFAKKISGPVQANATAAIKLARGEVLEPLVTPLLEANAVSEALAKASQDLAARTTSLARNEAMLRSVFEQSAVGFERVGLDGRILDVNERLCRLLGFRRQEYVGRTFRELTEPEDLRLEEDKLVALLSGEIESYVLEKRLISKSGAHVWVRITSSLVHDQQSVGIYRSSVIEDVTESRRSRIEVAQLAAIVEASADGLVSASLDGSIQTWNPGAEALFGYTAAEIIGRPLADLVPPDQMHELRSDLTKVSLGETVKREGTRRHKDGHFVQILTTASPMTNSGKVNALSVAMEDISERKQREAQVNLLNRELAHRVKNTLAVTQSLANQTLRNNTTAEGFRRAFQGRLQALAAATDMLTENDWGVLEFSELVNRLENVFGTAPGKLRKSGPRVNLPSDLSVPLALALHELGTNALKYGAWSVDEGHVELVWGVQKDAVTSQLSIRWSEHGGPVVRTLGSKGFGTVLIERTIPGAVVKQSFDEPGLLCIIELDLGHRAGAEET